MATAAQKMAEAYATSWGEKPNSENCSGFLKSLQTAFGFAIPDFQADLIIAWLDGESSRASFHAGKFGVGQWKKLAVGDWQRALQEAKAGKFVVAGLKSSEYKPGTTNGHVAVVLPKTGGPNGEPLLYGGGSALATSPGTRHLGQVWAKQYHSRIRYYVHAAASIGQYDRE